jgi:hypothetical protein
MIGWQGQNQLSGLLSLDELYSGKAILRPMTDLKFQSVG